MTILIQCTDCRERFPVPAGAVGREVLCPTCRAPIMVTRDALTESKSGYVWEPAIGVTKDTQSESTVSSTSGDRGYTGVNRATLTRPYTLSRSKPSGFWVALACSCGAIAALVTLGALYYQGAFGKASSEPKLENPAPSVAKSEPEIKKQRVNDLEAVEVKADPMTEGRTDVIARIDPGVVTLLTDRGTRGVGSSWIARA